MNKNRQTTRDRQRQGQGGERGLKKKEGKEGVDDDDVKLC